jgi:hypothetical protein
MVRFFADAGFSKSRGSRIYRSSDNLGKMMMAKSDDWRTPLVHYLENPNHVADRKIQRQALKYVVLDTDLYRCTIDELLLKCLDSDQSRIAVGRFMNEFVVHISQLIR